VFSKKLSVAARVLVSGRFLKYSRRDDYPGFFDDKKCIFIHVPKAAGSSVCMQFFGAQSGHRKYVNYWLDSPDKADEYFKFTFVRNPYDRLVSAFHFLKAGGMDVRDKEWSQKNLSKFNTFEDFVLNWVTEENVATKNHFEPQLSFICMPGSKVPKVDYIGRVENFDEGMAYVGSRIGVPIDETVKVNRSRRSDFRTYYSDEMISIVRRVYSDDIEVLGYDFEM